jgi:hypothetical protein
MPRSSAKAMRPKTKKKRRISSVAALREAEGAVPRDQESGRSRPLPAVGSAAQVGRAPVVRSAAYLRERHPADLVLGAVARLGTHLEARHRSLVAAGEPAQAVARARSPAPVAAAVPRKRQPRALRSPPTLESRVERSPRASPSRAPPVGRLAERRAPKRAPRKVPRKRAAPVPAPRAAPRLAERAPVRRAALGDRFFCPRAQCPRRGYSQVAALFLKEYYAYGRAFS